MIEIYYVAGDDIISTNCMIEFTMYAQPGCQHVSCVANAGFASVIRALIPFGKAWRGKMVFFHFKR